MADSLLKTGLFTMGTNAPYDSQKGTNTPLSSLPLQERNIPFNFSD